MVDGYGVLHPRRCGSASHLGVVAGVASVGVAKNLLAVEGLDRQAVAAALAAEGPAGESSGTAGAGGAGGGRPQAAQQQGTRQVAQQQGTPQVAQQQGTRQAAQQQGTRQVAQQQGTRQVAQQQGTRQVALVAASGETLGMAVCLGGNTKPVFVSVGGRRACMPACLQVVHAA
jgi:deoxyinosine 3'endonuclease (endonuclease V)